MAKEDRKLKYQAVQSMFLKGNVKKMKDIETLYPTMISKDLKINHSRYIQRLYKPDLFNIKQIKALAALLEINPQIILDIILKQPPSSNRPRRKKS